MFGFITKKTGKRLATPIIIQCPHCDQATSGSSQQCQHCGTDITLEASLERTVEPVRRTWQYVEENLGPFPRRCLQWGYGITSAFVFWKTLAYAEEHHASNWLLHAALAVVYFGVLLFLFVRLVDRSLLLRVARAPGITKLAVFFNYLTTLVFLQVALDTWWHRATMLAVLFAVSWLGTKLFVGFIDPNYKELVDILFREANNPVNARSPQGRRGYYD